MSGTGGNRRAAWKYGGVVFGHGAFRGEIDHAIAPAMADEQDDDAPELDGRDVDLLARRGQINLVTWLDD